MVTQIMIDDNDHDQDHDHGWCYMDLWIHRNNDLLIASEAPKLPFNVVISKQAVVFIGTILAIVPDNYLNFSLKETSIIKIELTDID